MIFESMPRGLWAEFTHVATFRVIFNNLEAEFEAEEKTIARWEPTWPAETIENKGPMIGGEGGIRTQQDYLDSVSYRF